MLRWMADHRLPVSIHDWTNGLGQVGQRMPNDMGLLGVLAMWPPMVSAGAVLVVAGAWEFTRRKAYCQQACCTPVEMAVGGEAGRARRMPFVPASAMASTAWVAAGRS